METNTKTRSKVRLPIAALTGTLLLLAPALASAQTAIAPAIDQTQALSELPAKAAPESRRPQQWLRTGTLTLLYAGTIALTFAGRHEEPSRIIATASGVDGGLTAGIAAVYLTDKTLHHDRIDHGDAGFVAMMLGGAVVGGVLGGLVAHAVAGSPGARAPVTAVGLAPFYARAIVATFD
jgi:hypothetical protein